MGLYLNPSKCEWTWLDPECKDLCPIQLKGVGGRRSGQVSAARPHRDARRASGKCEIQLRVRGEEAHEAAVTAISEFEDSQAAFYLLRVSYSIVWAVHFMRTTPLEHGLEGILG